MGGVQTASWKSIPNGPRYLTLIERWGLSLQTAHSHLIGPTGQCWMSTQTYSTILWGMQRRSRFKVNREFNMKLVFQLMWFLLSNWSSLKRLGLAPLLTTTSFCKTCQVASTYCSASSNSAHSYSTQFLTPLIPVLLFGICYAGRRYQRQQIPRSWKSWVKSWCAVHHCVILDQPPNRSSPFPQLWKRKSSLTVVQRINMGEHVAQAPAHRCPLSTESTYPLCSASVLWLFHLWSWHCKCKGGEPWETQPLKGPTLYTVKSNTENHIWMGSRLCRLWF
jgi:hypothetical protein